MKVGSQRKRRERALAVGPILADLNAEVIALRWKYDAGKPIGPAVASVRSRLEDLEDAVEKNREAEAQE